MGVYILGMEMPKTCGKCQIKNAIECNRWKLVRSVVFDRHKDCPLVPVQTHGDLVDVNDLLHDKQGQKLFRGDFRIAFCQIIERAPTIIPAEEGET